MSLFSSMNTAITGLSAQSHALGAISDNIANSSTVGYKKVGTAFQSMVTASSPEIHTPGAVTARPIRFASIQGNVQQTQVDTNLSINGAGFFNVSSVSTRPDGTTAFDTGIYTRAGDFMLDKNGYLVNSAGYVLNGQSVTDPATGRVSPTVSPIQINRVRDQAISSSFVSYAANLPAAVSSADDIDTTDVDVDLPPTQTTVFDPYGNKRTLDLQWSKLDPSNPANAGRWMVSVSLAGADMNGAGAGTSDVYYAQFNTSGPSTGTLQWIKTENAAPAPLPTAGTAAIETLTVSEPDGSSWDLDLRLGNYGETEGVTQFASNGIEGMRVETDGVALGTLGKISFDRQGFLYLNYDNGRTVSAYKIPVAIFEAPDALEADGKTAFRASYGSGPASLVSPGDRGAGEITPLSLEASNVDIADEFTKMIVTQRAYSANARVVTASDQMLQETLQIVR